MEETRPSNQRLIFLSPVEKLKERCLQEFNDYTLKEYRLKKETESLKAFVDLFLLANGKTEENCIIWITEDSFVLLGNSSDSSLPAVYRDRQLGLCLSHSNLLGEPLQYLHIHSSTLEEAIPGLDLLAGLKDTHFKGMRLSTHGPGEHGPYHCPFTNRLLEKILLQNPERHNIFSQMKFTAEQGRVLAVTGTGTDIGFIDCEFEDGDAFVEAFAAWGNSGPVKLTISGRLPFQNVEQFVLFLQQQRKLEFLALCYFPLVGDICRALAAAEIPDLDLHGYTLEDGGAALVESVSVGRGPKGLAITRTLFDSDERVISFVSALRGNTYLERLELGSFDNFREGTAQALAPALRVNKGLTNLTLSHYCLDNRSWSELMDAISTHPSLRVLKFERIYDENTEEPSLSMKRDRTSAVADMLLVNKQVDEIPFDENTFDRSNWEKLVVPRLECNLYGKLFPVLQKIQVPSTRAATVATALASVASKPSLLWMVLSQNTDVLCNYLDKTLTHANSLSVPSGKRSRSLFSGE
jgi:hypothetical protein